MNDRILKRNYLHFQNGKWYRLEVAKGAMYTCDGCAFFNNAACFAKGDAEVTCSSCGENYNAVWREFQIPAGKADAGHIMTILDDYVVSRRITARTIQSYGRTGRIQFEMRSDGRQRIYDIHAVFRALWEDGCFENNVKDLNTPYRTDIREWN